MANTIDLRSIWSKTKDQAEKEGLDLAFEELKSNGDTSLILLKKEISAAKKDLQSAIGLAKEKADFNTIANARIKVKALEVKFEEYQNAYNELFAE